MATIIEAAWMLHLKRGNGLTPQLPTSVPLHQEEGRARAKWEPGLQQPHHKHYNHRGKQLYHQLNFLCYICRHILVILHHSLQIFAKQPSIVSGDWSVCWKFLAHYGTLYWCTFRVCSHFGYIWTNSGLVALLVWFTNEVFWHKIWKPLCAI